MYFLILENLKCLCFQLSQRFEFFRVINFVYVKDSEPEIFSREFEKRTSGTKGVLFQPFSSNKIKQLLMREERTKENL